MMPPSQSVTGCGTSQSLCAGRLHGVPLRPVPSPGHALSPFVSDGETSPPQARATRGMIKAEKIEERRLTRRSIATAGPR